MKTEIPKSAQIRRAVAQVLSDSTYRQCVQQLSREFATYHPNQLAEQYISELMADPNTVAADAVA